MLDGRFEKEFTLDWAKRLKPLLETNGWTVFLTRTSDVYVTNSYRVTFAEMHRADLFISLHFNSTSGKTGNEKTAGLETYCITPTGMPSTLTRGFRTTGRKFFRTTPSTRKTSSSPSGFTARCCARWAWKIAVSGVRGSTTVLRGQNRPAILVEGGYLSNPAEAELIESAEYRQKLAEAVAGTRFK